MSFSISRVEWDLAAPLLKTVRERVFICEWRIPKKIEFDRKDKSAFHMLVCDDSTQEPVATGRISANGEISRIAVMMDYRKNSIDKFVLQGLISIANDLKLSEVFIYSPLEFVSYFEQQNFSVKGAVFMEAGIPRQRMVCPLKELNMAKYYLVH
jgi:predicted GNAT family N-acyltransferase